MPKNSQNSVSAAAKMKTSKQNVIQKVCDAQRGPGWGHLTADIFRSGSLSSAVVVTCVFDK